MNTQTQSSKSSTAGRGEMLRGDSKFFHTKVVTVTEDTSLEDAARIMRDNHIGDVIVCAEGAKSIPTGILTDRDIALCVVGVQDGAKRKVGEIMARTPACARVDDDPFTMIEVMRREGVGRLPLVDEDGSLAGIVTARNLINKLVQGMNDLSLVKNRQKENEVATTMTSNARH